MITLSGTAIDSHTVRTSKEIPQGAVIQISYELPHSAGGKKNLASEYDVMSFVGRHPLSITDDEMKEMKSEFLSHH